MNSLKHGFKGILKAVGVGSAYYYLKERVYLKMTAVVVQKDLSALSPLEPALDRAGVEILRISTSGVDFQPLNASARVRYRSQERRDKALFYLRKGYRGVALVKDGEICGDIWYWGHWDSHAHAVHPDLGWLAISCGCEDAYGFDLYICPDDRGKDWSRLLQSAALRQMKDDGFKRALGYYVLDNLPALWVHRTLKWSEVQRVEVARFFFLRQSRVKPSNLASAPPKGQQSPTTTTG